MTYSIDAICIAARRYARRVDVTMYVQRYRDGLEVTDLYAREPGKGNGSKALTALLRLADAASLPVRLRPACAHSRRFYERHGFALDPRLFATLVRFPPVNAGSPEKRV